jgi:hypothetical protein
MLFPLSFILIILFVKSYLFHHYVTTVNRTKIFPVPVCVCTATANKELIATTDIYYIDCASLCWAEAIRKGFYEVNHYITVKAVISCLCTKQLGFLI